MLKELKMDRWRRECKNENEIQDERERNEKQE
jgi:hypothetical protein